MKKNKIDLSLIIPVYNVEKYLSATRFIVKSYNK